MCKCLVLLNTACRFAADAAVVLLLKRYELPPEESPEDYRDVLGAFIGAA